MSTLILPSIPKRWLLGSVLVLLLSLAGCNKASSPTAQPAAVTITVGTEPTFPPFEARGEKGEFVGFDIDLMRAIGAKAGFNVQFKDLGFDALISALNAGQIDVIASAMSITEERKNAVDFSDPYVEAGLVIAVRQSDQGMQTGEVLSGKTIAVQQGSTGAEEADKLKAAGSVKEVRYFQTVTLAMMELTKGGVDAVVNDRPTAESYMASNPNQVRLLPEPLKSDRAAGKAQPRAQGAEIRRISRAAGRRALRRQGGRADRGRSTEKLLGPCGRSAARAGEGRRHRGAGGADRRGDRNSAGAGAGVDAAIGQPSAVDRSRDVRRPDPRHADAGADPVRLFRHSKPHQLVAGGAIQP
jgi:ABC-type amino acid transport substrate-binding protein